MSKSSSTTVLCNFCPKAVKEKEPKGESPRWRLQNKRALFATSLATRLPVCPLARPTTRPHSHPSCSLHLLKLSNTAASAGGVRRRRRGALRLHAQALQAQSRQVRHKASVEIVTQAQNQLSLFVQFLSESPIVSGPCSIEALENQNISNDDVDGPGAGRAPGL